MSETRLSISGNSPVLPEQISFADLTGLTGLKTAEDVPSNHPVNPVPVFPLC
jgi:hypothetical protein